MSRETRDNSGKHRLLPSGCHPTEIVAAARIVNAEEFIERLMLGRTTIVIAHRLSTIRNADKIVVLDEKIIIETGTLRKLIQVDGVYKRLVSIQQQVEPGLGRLN